MMIYDMAIKCNFFKNCNKLWYNGVIKTFENKQIGTFNFVINDNNVTIKDIEINEEYRRRGYGSYTLKKIENYAIEKYDVKKVNSLVWDINGSNSNFLKYNNYNIVKLDNNIDRIYNLIDFEKSLN